MHTYITNGEVYTVGFLMVQKSSGVQSFVPLFDVGSMRDAAIAVSALNGGGPTLAIKVLKEYTEGISPQPASN
jgi:hypothetical protein